MSAAQSIRDMLGGIARQDFPALNVAPGPWSYRVSAVRSDGRCDLRAIKEGPPTELPNVDHWTASGAASKPVVGSIVVVSFLDGDPGAPMIGGYLPLRLPGGAPVEATLDATNIKIGPVAAGVVQIAGGGPKAARAGDACYQLVLAHTPPGPASLWYREKDGDTYTAVAFSPGMPDHNFAGTPILIVEGSFKVSIG
jgi:hypothetical protein